MPLLTYYGSVALEGNGFVAAFVSGTAFAWALDRTRTDATGSPDSPDVEDSLLLAEWASVALGYLVWTLFGFVALGTLTQILTWQAALFAVLSLTVLRMLPVSLALLGTGLRVPSVLFVGWFGPRGLASVVFSVIAIESLPMSGELAAGAGDDRPHGSAQRGAARHHGRSLGGPVRRVGRARPAACGVGGVGRALVRPLGRLPASMTGTERGDPPDAAPADVAAWPTMNTQAAPTPPAVEGREYLRLIGLGAAIGVPAAFVALAFLGIVHAVEHWLWHSVPDAMGLDSPPWWMVLTFPVVGAALVWLARVALPGDGGHEPVYGLNAAPTPLAYAPGVALAAFGSLAFGAVVGPEAPLIALGSAVGMIAVRWWKVQDPGDRVLSTAGSFSAVSALFGGPVVAGALLLEAGVSAGAAILPVLIPGAVASAIGYLLVTGVGGWAGIPTGSLTVPDLPVYDSPRIVDLVVAVVVGLVVAILVRLVHGSALAVLGRRGRFGVGPSLLLGGLATGGLALVIIALGGTYNDVLFSGQTDLPALLAEDSEWLILAIIATKAIAYAVCLGVGFRGGPIFPAIFLGVGVAVLVGGLFDMSPTVALAIGTACGMAAFSRLIFSSLVFVLLLVGVQNSDVIPAAVLAACTGWVVAHSLDKRAQTAAAAAVAAEPTA